MRRKILLKIAPYLKGFDDNTMLTNSLGILKPISLRCLLAQKLATSRTARARLHNETCFVANIKCIHKIITDLFNK